MTPDPSESFEKKLKGFIDEADRFMQKQFPQLREHIESENALDELISDICQGEQVFEDNIRTVLNSVSYDDESWFVKDFEASTSETVASAMMETWINCRHFAAYYTILATQPWKVLPETVILNMALGRIRYLNRFGKYLCLADAEIYQVDSFFVGLGYDEDPIRLPSDLKLRALPDEAVRLLGDRLYGLSRRLDLLCRAYCGVVEAFSFRLDDGRAVALFRQAHALVLQMEMVLLKSQRLWVEKENELSRSKEG